MSPFGKCLLILCPEWIPAKGVGGQSVNGNSEISNLFLHPGSNPFFFFLRMYSKENKPAWD